MLTRNEEANYAIAEEAARGEGSFCRACLGCGLRPSERLGQRLVKRLQKRFGWGRVEVSAAYGVDVCGKCEGKGRV